MNSTHGTHASRAIALLLLACVVAFAIAFLFLPMANYVSAEVQQAKTLRSSIEQLRLLSKNGERFRHVLVQLEQRDLGAQFFLKAQKSATAAAEIEQLLKLVVSRRGGAIVSTQALPEKAADDVRSVAVKVNIRGKLPQISMLLHDLESFPTALYVRNLSIRARNSAVRRPGQEREWRDLDVQFELMGYLRARVKT